MPGIGIKAKRLRGAAHITGLLKAILPLEAEIQLVVKVRLAGDSSVGRGSCHDGDGRERAVNVFLAPAAGP